MRLKNGVFSGKLLKIKRVRPRMTSGDVGPSPRRRRVPEHKCHINTLFYEKNETKSRGDDSPMGGAGATVVPLPAGMLLLSHDGPGAVRDGTAGEPERGAGDAGVGHRIAAGADELQFPVQRCGFAGCGAGDGALAGRGTACGPGFAAALPRPNLHAGRPHGGNQERDGGI